MTAIGKSCVAGLRRFLGDRGGVAATEFALLLPVMLTMIIGTVEIGNALIADRKITAAVQTAADLVAQKRDMSNADIDDVFAAVEIVLSPLEGLNAGTTIYSVVMDQDEAISVDWSDTRGAGAPAPSEALPPNLLTANSSVIVVDMVYHYQPVFMGLFVPEFEISDRAYLRPRSTQIIARSN